MNLTEFAIKRTIVSWMVALLIIGGGILSFMGLGRLEDPEFTIKEAVIITAYPGASALEVEEEVTLQIENTLQQLSYVDNIRSISSNGLSQVTVEMKSIYRKADLAQIWDEMRRKIRDMQASLPPGVQTPVINDDFGDVFGVFMAITGTGYSYEELADYVDILRRELVLIDGVGKIAVGGQRQEQVIIEIPRSQLTSLNISLSRVQALLQTQNIVTDAGHLRVGSEYIRLSTSGAYDNVEQLKNLMIGQTDSQIIYLGDVAHIKRDYQTPPRHIYRFNGQQALTVGISFSSGVNVVKIGAAIRDKLADLEYLRPIGMQIDTIYDQPHQVDSSVTEFLVSLGQAVLIVVVVLLIAMGLRSGLLMSLILLLTILATFIGMKLGNIDLHRISLGALVIALGMLVDNAIVITEGILIGMKKGLTRIEAAKKIVNQTIWPLLNATIISIAAFAPIGLSPDASGEFTGALFWVLLISLLISWVLAITLTPFFAVLLFPEQANTPLETEEIDPYKGIFYQIYKMILMAALRSRIITSFLMIGALASAIYGFGFVNQAFFPPSNLPVITVDYWLPEGSDIRATQDDMAEIETVLLAHQDIAKVTTSIGQGAMRFLLTYAGERSYASFGQFIVEAKPDSDVDALQRWIDQIIRTQSPQAFSKSDRIFIGPATKAKIEARIIGPDDQVLRHIGQQYMDIFHQDPDTVNVRHDWRERTKVLKTEYLEAQARRLGVSKEDLDKALALNTNGLRIGLLRDGSTLLPIILRPAESQSQTVNQLGDTQIFSPALNRYVSLDQVTNGIQLDWENPLIMRRDRKRTLQVWADPDPLGPTNSFALFARIKPQIEAVPLPNGYQLEWGGEFEAQQKANKAVFAFVPLGILVMVALTILLFNSVKQTLVIWLTVPLSIIGVTIGLLTFNQPFSFTALLGFLSLSGMLLKNSIVLVEEIKRLNEEENIGWHDAISLAAVSRLRPVVMAAITTILGLIPLLGDVFFAPLAVTIMFGLGFATILTLIVVPVLFALFYRIKYT